MGTSDKALKIAVVATIAAAAAYLGYRAYKKRYPFERIGQACKKTETAPGSDSPAIETEKAVSVDIFEKALSEEEKINIATAARSNGNEAFKSGDYDLAVKYYDQAIESYPSESSDKALVLANRAACYMKLSRFDAVIADCSEALKIQPESLKALDRRSRAYENLDRLEDALVDATAACIIDDFKKSNLVERVENILRTLSTNYATSDFKSRSLVLPSDSLMEEFFSTFPNELDLAAEECTNLDLKTTVDLIKEKKYSAAYNSAIKALESEDGRSKALSLMGTFEFLKGDNTAALDYFNKSLDEDGKNSNVLVKLALAQLEENEFVKVTQYLETAFAVDSTNPSVFYHRGEILALSGSLENAIQDFSTAIELKPDFVLAFVHKARALLGLDRVSEAEELMKAAMKLFPNNVEVRNSFGEVLVMKGDYDGADRAFNAILKKHPNSPQVYLNKALLAMSRNKDTEAAKSNLNRALEVDPTFEAAHIQLANLLLSSEDFKGSMDHFDAAIRSARTFQELTAIHSLKCASVAQLAIGEKFPTLASKLKTLTQISPT